MTPSREQRVSRRTRYNFIGAFYALHTRSYFVSRSWITYRFAGTGKSSRWSRGISGYSRHSTRRDSKICVILYANSSRITLERFLPRPPLPFVRNAPARTLLAPSTDPPSPQLISVRVAECAFPYLFRFPYNTRREYLHYTPPPRSCSLRTRRTSLSVRRATDLVSTVTVDAPWPITSVRVRERSVLFFCFWPRARGPAAYLVPTSQRLQARGDRTTISYRAGFDNDTVLSFHRHRRNPDCVFRRRSVRASRPDNIN